MSHWYLQDGTPFHFQPDGRATTLRHARKENALPSVTTIMNLLDKPALTNWKMKQVLLASLTLPQIENEPPDNFAARIMRDAFKESEDARDRGSEIHNAIETWWKGKPLPKGDIGEIAWQAINQIIDYCDCDEFTPEATVVGDGYGGMVDLHNDEFVIDYKTKDITDKKLAYPEHCMQLAAYEKALPPRVDPEKAYLYAQVGVTPDYDTRRCINVFIDRTEPGKVIIHEWSPEEVEHEWRRFQLLVKLWQLSKNYYPEMWAA